jgi:la-related protein 1
VRSSRQGQDCTTTERALQSSSQTENTYTMATSNISNGDAAANKSSFSYAQAAKGSSAPPTPSLQSESNTWSGAVDPSTSSDDPSHGLDVSSSKNGDAESSSSTSTKDEKAAPSVVSDLAASSVLAGKDEDTISDVTSRSESAVEQSFQQAASGVQTPETSEEKEVPRGKGKKKSEAKEKAEQAEKPAPIPLKEAPMPSVNIWQQRAQEAKQKQPASTSSVSEKVQPLTTTNSKSMEGASAPAGQTQQTRSPSHPQRDEGASRSLPLPPRNDAMSWPTPLSAQEVQEKSDKEKPGTSTAPTKSHGKSEWKPVPYTPSVKFNTPMPAIRGKTARTGARGGRMAGPGDRTTPMLPNGHTNEVEGDFKPRAKSEGGLMRSSTLPSNSRRPAGSHGSTENPSTSVAESSAVASTTNHGATTENGDSQQGFAPGEMASGSLASGDIGNGAMSAQSANGELATAAADPSSTTMQQSKVPRRRGSHAAGSSEFAGGEKKRASESGVAGDRPSWIETREKGEGRKESWPVSQRERPDGRPERGRGHKGSRGLHSQAPHMGLPQYGMPQGMIAGHHSKNPSFTYYPPGPPQASRGYRQGRASMPVDGNFARFGFPAGQPYMDYSYPNAMYGYQAPLPASTFSYAPQMEQQVIISAISVQL